MFCGKGGTDGSPLRNAEQRHWFANLRGVYDVFEIFDPSLEGEISDVHFGHSASAFIVADVAKIAAEELHPMPPDRTLPFVLEMCQPVGGFYDHRSGARLGPGEPDPVGRAHIPNGL